MMGTSVKCIIIFAIALACLPGSAGAQSCDSLRGSVNCNVPGAGNQPPAPAARSDWNFGSAPAAPGLGSDLLTGRSDDDTAMLGGIVFGGSGATCMGPFRWRQC
jgi:hypothetical protein